MSLREYLHSVARCPTLEELWDLHTTKMAAYGFDRLLYGFTRYRTSNSLGDPEDFVILTNHSRAYTDEFLGNGLYYHAPMVRWALEHDGACSWTVLHDMARENAMTPAEARVIDFNRRMDVTAGYTVSFKSISARSKGAIALTAKSGMTQEDVDRVWEQHGSDIKLMNEIAHLKILTLPYHSQRRALTRRQREALEWVGDGKTMQDIAVIMGLTSATVEKHLRLAREALAVETTAQAVLKAAFSNQMFVLDA
ncbi:LuxR family transcriptional regulator [Sulfitobacter alexandrii]|uniref:LuxR family transcriptional regulator n=1 Tax=Sulfitobacter alexandrii TaxID=1917485 RepID=A0A1J0WGM8_9RHOB|nr:LuxR family transcriptional regulator [Sulfitobacter alexandrii]APE43471.1 LuxR family transcriptional regulator [Sulfitobacter alexandrii]